MNNFSKNVILLRSHVLELLIEDSKLFEQIKIKDPKQYVEDTTLAMQRLEFIYSKKSQNLINIFRLDSDEDDRDFELAILRAFLNCKSAFVPN